VLSQAGDVYVDGYFKNNGTYVQPHFKSAPDNNPHNNWSFPGEAWLQTSQRISRSHWKPDHNNPKDLQESLSSGWHYRLPLPRPPSYLREPSRHERGRSAHRERTARS
jgi:hypothetical protein